MELPAPIVSTRSTFHKDSAFKIVQLTVSPPWTATPH